MNPLLLFFLFRAPETKLQPTLLRRLLVTALPGQSAERLVITAIDAEKESKQQAEAERLLVEDAMKAADFENMAALAAFPTLEAAFKRLPVSAQAVLFPPSQSPPEGEIDPTIRRRKKT